MSEINCELMSRLKVHLTCPICLDLMCQPTTLSCGHSGCLPCQTQAVFNTGQCPECRSKQTVPLAVNRSLESLLEEFRTDTSRGHGASEMGPQTTLLPCEQLQAEQLRCAIAYGESSNFLNMLLAGYNPNSRTPLEGHNALSHAVTNNRLDFAILLVNGGAHIDLPDADGDTPLMNAVYFRRQKTTRFLLERGANPLIMAHLGMTALHYAKGPGKSGAPPQEEITAMLENAVTNWAPPIDYVPPPPFQHVEGVRHRDGWCDLEECYNITSFEHPVNMRVVVSSPMVRVNYLPTSSPAGRLREDDVVQVTKVARWGETEYVRFENGPVHCPSGWLPFRLPFSNTTLLTRVEVSNPELTEGPEVETVS